MNSTSNRFMRTASKPIISIAMACAVLMLGACSTGVSKPESHASKPSAFRAEIEALAENFNLSNTPVSPEQSRIIFYSPPDVSKVGAASIYINGRYHASLVPGGYSPICIKPGTLNLGVRHMDVQTRPYKDGFDAITSVQANSGENLYVRINGQDAQSVALVPVTAQSALSELPSTRLQIHTISRVADASECIDAPIVVAEPPPAPPAPVIPPAPVVKPPRQLLLAGDTLFRFNQSNRSGLTQQGLAAIDLLMAQIRLEFSRIDQIHVIGHADPIGNDKANETLSTARAQTVRDYMAMRLANEVPVTFEGRGERDPVVQCGDRPTPANIACNQPNRRVVIEVSGTER
jgi:OmpA-OmpF porin, OOP family